MIREHHLLLEVAIKELYESLNKGEFGGVSFSSLPVEEQIVWREAASKWINNFLEASYDLALSTVKEKITKAVLESEFPMDASTGLKVIRTEALLNMLSRLQGKQK